MGSVDPHQQKQEVLGKAKEFIGNVRGDEERAAEGRAQREEVQRNRSLKEAVDDAILGASGSKHPVDND